MSIEQANVELAQNSSEIHEQITNQGYANVSFGLGAATCKELFENFADFVALCQEPGGQSLVDAVTFKVTDNGYSAYQLTQRKPGVFNPLEDQREPGKDHKFVMHYGVHTITHARGKLGELPEEMDTFLANCDELYTEGRRAGKFASRSLGLGNILFTNNRFEDLHHLRLINYIEPHGEIHFDRSVATLAISESAPGLRGLASDNGYLKPLSKESLDRLRSGNLPPIKHYEHIAKFFTGAGLRRLPPDIRVDNDLDSLPLFAHDIVNNSPGTNRQAAVMFFNPHLHFKDYAVPSVKETSIRF